MTVAINEIIAETTEGSLSGTLTFPEVVRTLIAAGVESYRVDLYRREKIGYRPGGESAVVPMGFEPAEVAPTFSEEAVVAALRASQRGEITYPTFLARIAAAGTTSYTVFVAGRCACYVGRDGNHYIERFPPSL
jgi:uncharacterized protein YbcV (DUF1398 family)